MTAPIVCISCICDDPEAAEVAALTAGLPILAACRATWGGAL